MPKRSYAMPSVIQHIKFLYRYLSTANEFLQLQPLSINNMKTRLSKSLVLKLILTPKTYSFSLITFQIRWFEDGGPVEDLSVGWWPVGRLWYVWWFGERPTGGSVVGGWWFCNTPYVWKYFGKTKDREEDARVNWESTVKKTYDSTLFNYKYF